MLRRIIKWIGEWLSDDITHYYYANGDEILTMGHQMLLEVNNYKKQTIMETSVAVAQVYKPKTYYSTSAELWKMDARVSKRGNILLGKEICPRLTIAMHMPNPSSVVYGITICSSDDVFNTKEGRRRARERMKEGMFARPVNPLYAKLTEEEAVGKIMDEIMASFYKNPAKLERKIADFNFKKKLAEQPSIGGAKVIV